MNLKKWVIDWPLLSKEEQQWILDAEFEFEIIPHKTQKIVYSGISMDMVVTTAQLVLTTHDANMENMLKLKFFDKIIVSTEHWTLWLN